MVEKLIEAAFQFWYSPPLVSTPLPFRTIGQGKMDLFAEKKDLFFIKVVGGEVELVRDADGKIEKLILHNGHDTPARRL
jgi:hypothetical protein